MSSCTPFAGVSTAELERMVQNSLKKQERAELKRRAEEEGDEEAQEVLDAARKRDNERRSRRNEKKKKRLAGDEKESRAYREWQKRQKVRNAKRSAKPHTATMQASGVGDEMATGDHTAANDDHEEDMSVVHDLADEESEESEDEVGVSPHFNEPSDHEIVDLDDSDAGQDAAIQAGLEVAESYLREVESKYEIIDVNRSGDEEGSTLRAHTDVDDQENDTTEAEVKLELEKMARRKALEEEEVALWKKLGDLQTARHNGSN